MRDAVRSYGGDKQRPQGRDAGMPIALLGLVVLPI
jgi:hypothetical protein